MTTIYCQSDSPDRDMRQHGCGPYSALNALRRASGGTWRARGAAGTLSARSALRRSGASMADFRARGLSTPELARSMAAVRASWLRRDLPTQVRMGVRVIDDLLPQVARIGGCALVPVDYGVVQRAGLGRGSYEGGHWVLAHDPDGGMVGIDDPLRRQPTRWPAEVLADAMASFGRRPWGHGRGNAIVVWPWLTWRESYPLVKAQRDAARSALAACEAAR